MSSPRLDDLSVNEKLSLLEEVWDSLCDETNPVASPEWHQEALQKRQERVRNGQSRFLTIEEVKSRFQNSEE